MSQITGLDQNNIARIGGFDRYDTSLEVAKYFNLSGRCAAIATGNNYPDALTGSIYAARSNASVILTDGSLNDNTKQFLANMKPTQVVIFGGQGVVSKGLEGEFGQLLTK